MSGFKPNSNNMILRSLSLLLLYTLLLNLPYIHLREFQGEEGRRVIIALNMLNTGDWIVPYVEGVVYLKKPPMFNWLLAGIFKLTGNVSEVTARIPSVITAFLTALVLSLFYKRLTKSESVWFILPGIIFLTFSEVIGKTIKSEIDVTFTLFVTISLLAWFYFYEVRSRPVLAWTVGLFFVGISFLTKGVQAPVFFYSSVIPYMVFRKELKKCYSLSHLAGIFIFLFVVMLWLIPLASRVGLDNLMNIWWREIAVRQEPMRGDGFFIHLVKFPFFYTIAYLPWIPLIGLWVRYRGSSENPFGLVKNAASFCFISLLFSVPVYWLIPGTILRYLLPVSGMLAILISIPLTDILTHKVKELMWFKLYLNFTGILLAVLAVSAPLWGNRFNLSALFPIMFLFGVFIGAIFLLLLKKPEWKMVSLIIVILFAKLSWASLYFPYYDKHYSHYRNAAQQINNIAPPDITLYDYGVDNPHLTYYLKRPVRFIASLESGVASKQAFIFMKIADSEKSDLKGLLYMGDVNARNDTLVLYKLEKNREIR